MAALDLQEQEQLETLKSWWKDNGTSITIVVSVFLIGTLGWWGLKTYQSKQAHDAATLFQQFNEQIGSNDPKRVNDAAAALTDKFGTTLYATKAALAAAQVNEQSKNLAQAKTQLTWVIEHAKEARLKDVARLRLAAILLDAKQYADALKQLEGEHPAAFDALYADLKGDVLAAQGKTAEAQAAYKLAFDKTDAKSNYRNLIEIKLDGLGAAK
ncbi:MAG: tetratricopeptide repeat protein [Gallionella sp.]|nr:tetratricopeptide repeat protein [Gallionella sp.]